MDSWLGFASERNLGDLEGKREAEAIILGNMWGSNQTQQLFKLFYGIPFYDLTLEGRHGGFSDFLVNT